MKKDYIHFSIILDRSGSMCSIQDATIKGFDAFMEEQRAQKGTASASLTKFDDRIELDYAFKDIQEVPKLDLQPRGSTALLDAIGVTLKNLNEKIKAMPDDEKPEQIVVVIITDGEENSSREYTYEKIAKKISKRTDKDNWKFVYLGANQDAIATGAKLNISAANSMTFAANATGTANTYASFSRNVSAYRSVKNDASMAFDLADRDNATK